jgi:hypothetical protein
MSESYVNKPYSEQELEQKLEKIRGDLSKKLGNWADRIQVSMTFAPKIERIEGETWNEEGKNYVMKDGIKQSVSLMQSVRMPWHCPKCSKSMNHRFDRKFFYLRGWCYNCNVDWEGQLRIEGKWEAFERRMIRENEKSFIRDKIQELSQYMKDFTVPTVYFEDGRFERLAEFEMFEDKFKELDNDIEFLLRRMDVIRGEEEAEEQYDETTISVA